MTGREGGGWDGFWWRFNACPDTGPYMAFLSAPDSHLSGAVWAEID